jgi:hypothetical protein
MNPIYNINYYGLTGDFVCPQTAKVAEKVTKEAKKLANEAMIWSPSLGVMRRINDPTTSKPKRTNFERE